MLCTSPTRHLLNSDKSEQCGHPRLEHRTTGSGSISTDIGCDFTLNPVGCNDCQYHSNTNFHHGDMLGQELDCYHAEQTDDSWRPCPGMFRKDSKSATAQKYKRQKGADRRCLKDDGVQKHGEDVITSEEQSDEC